jgi:hypothetical protein
LPDARRRSRPLPQVKQCLRLADQGKVYEPKEESTDNDPRARADEEVHVSDTLEGIEDEDERPRHKPRLALSRHDAGRLLGEEIGRGKRMIMRNREKVVSNTALVVQRLGLLGEQAARLYCTKRRRRRVQCELASAGPLREGPWAQCIETPCRAAPTGFALWGTLIVAFLLLMPRVRRALLKQPGSARKGAFARKAVRSD